MEITTYTICPHCQKAYKDPDPSHVGKEVICRCHKRFVVEVTPSRGRRTGCKYNLITDAELVEASEKSSSPGGILPHEFQEILKSVDVTEAILKEINKDRKRHLDASDVAELIERLQYLREDADTD
jgi:hypothetical protein